MLCTITLDRERFKRLMHHPKRSPRHRSACSNKRDPSGSVVQKVRGLVYDIPQRDLFGKQKCHTWRKAFETEMGRKSFLFPSLREAWQCIRPGIKVKKYSEKSVLPEALHYPPNPAAVPRFVEQENTHKVMDIKWGWFSCFSAQIPLWISSRLRKRASPCRLRAMCFVLANVLCACYKPWGSKTEWCTLETAIKQSDRPVLLSAHVQHMRWRRKSWAPE